MVHYRLARDAAQGLAERIRAGGGDAEVCGADLARREQAEALVAATLGRFGALDILVNNAGIWKGAPLDAMEDGAWEEMLAVNLSGPFYVTRAAVRAMKPRRWGRIVNVSSTAGQRGEAGHSHYAATKGALIAWTKSLAVELAPFGILVNAVAPGWTDTDMARDALRGPEGARILETIPLRRAGRPEEIAGAVLFLVSDLATYITGEILNVNGGSVLCG